nr:MAG: hypothetical protein 3 [Gammacarmovirus sp.]
MGHCVCHAPRESSPEIYYIFIISLLLFVCTILGQQGTHISYNHDNSSVKTQYVGISTGSPNG